MKKVISVVFLFLLSANILITIQQRNSISAFVRKSFLSKASLESIPMSDSFGKIVFSIVWL